LCHRIVAVDILSMIFPFSIFSLTGVFLESRLVLFDIFFVVAFKQYA